MFRTASTDRRVARPGRLRRSGAFAVAAAVLLAGVLPAVSSAAEFRSIGASAAVLYDGPSVKGRKMFVAPRGMPVEVLSEVNQWVKVRDQGGDVLWAEKKDLSAVRSPVASTNMIVRSAPQDNAQIVVQLDRGVPLTLVDSSVPAGWLRVRLPDGTGGFVRGSDVWGL
ncbi:MAG: SH3 domain-containing protein [Burkholderiaceae bacterium]